MPIAHVSDTAHWVAMYRAWESEREDALFSDPYARRMAGQLGTSIVREIPLGESMAWAMIVRTAVIDELILDCVANGATRIVNLGAGLDTRAFRLRLPGTLHWVDVDLPDTVAYRQECLENLKPRCIHAHVAADVTNDAELQRALSATSIRTGPTLVVSEGLLVYLKPSEVGALATSLSEDAAVRWWLTDLVSPMLLRLVGDRWPTNEAAASAPFQFAPGDSVAFFEHWGWRETSFRSTLEEAIRLQRPPPMFRWWGASVAPWWPRAPESLRRMTGIALMESIGLSCSERPLNGRRRARG